MKWIAPRNSAALILFFIIGVTFEVLLISAFQTLGLSDSNAWTSTLLVPGTNWSFTASVSLIFHIFPLSVIIVLLASWSYMTKSAIFITRQGTTRRLPPPTRHAQETGRFKSAKRFWRKLSRRIQRFGTSLRTGMGKLPGISSVSRRLSYSQSAAKSAITILFIFGSIALGLFLVEYPSLIYYVTLNLYRGSPALVDFVSGTGQWLRGVSMAVQPIGDLGASITNALIQGAPGFRHSLEVTGTSITRPIFQLDVVGKYAVSQNLAAWTPAILALVYGTYVSTRHRRRVKGR
ncbi:MAG TPA: hypothetical protein VJ249_02455 [Candidatus Bathyarchaeia archaeon]|nr:hypothetical protein [Candidatus Bathyarchaeia archaeon]